MPGGFSKWVKSLSPKELKLLVSILEKAGDLGKVKPAAITKALRSYGQTGEFLAKKFARLNLQQEEWGLLVEAIEAVASGATAEKEPEAVGEENLPSWLKGMAESAAPEGELEVPAMRRKRGAQAAAPRAQTARRRVEPPPQPEPPQEPIEEVEPAARTNRHSAGGSLLTLPTTSKGWVGFLVVVFLILVGLGVGIGLFFASPKSLSDGGNVTPDLVKAVSASKTPTLGPTRTATPTPTTTATATLLPPVGGITIPFINFNIGGSQPTAPATLAAPPAPTKAPAQGQTAPTLAAPATLRPPASGGNPPPPTTQPASAGKCSGTAQASDQILLASGGVTSSQIKTYGGLNRALPRLTGTSIPAPGQPGKVLCLTESLGGPAATYVLR